MISVIIPVYKVEKYLSRCVNSIINQTYKELEIILVDDGSPDNCGNICDDFSKLDARIKVIHKENGGLSSARNNGLLVAKGEYIAYADSDDYVDITMYEKMINCLENSNADIVQCGYSIIYEDDNQSILQRKDVLLNSTIIESKKSILDAFFEIGKIDHVVWNKLYKREVVENVQMVEGRWYEDTMATFDILLNAHSMVTIAEPLYMYIQRSDSIMGKAFCEKNFDSLYAAEYVALKAHEYAKPFVNHAKILLCLNCAYLYIKLRLANLDIPMQSKHSKRIWETFIKAWAEAKNDFKHVNMKNSSKIMIRLYRFSPNILYYVYSMKEKLSKVRRAKK